MSKLLAKDAKAILDMAKQIPAPKQADIDKAALAAITCKSAKEFSSFLGISEPVFVHWCNKYPSYKKAVWAWRDVATNEIEVAMAKRAIGFKKTTRRDVLTKAGTVETLEIETYYPPDVTAAQFWLKNRNNADWQDKKEVDVNVVANIRQWLVEAGPSDPTEVIDGTAKLISHEIEEAVFEAVDDGQSQREEEMLHSVQAEVESSLNGDFVGAAVSNVESSLNVDNLNATPSPQSSDTFSAFNKGWS